MPKSKYKKALDAILNSNIDDECKKLMQDALNKATPKDLDADPSLDTKDEDMENDPCWFAHIEVYCPTCGTQLNYVYNDYEGCKYCPECGQKIKKASWLKYCAIAYWNEDEDNAEESI